ncbi:hypothetical protein CC85DRAFT_282220 [Cutaneotrichosporon oleaginosum]|uniref:Uncharacterized protein n=1 Tax=Cutaneotrichosporon oleaginosum TaxID=879819 RepID=A0A0J0XX27_9TREE|nr:uncharacterized protein CC85DRAFT_282220 [Cutaneotrichosporon oleaginosum]KLT45598.1 hypothetical protein CC85DRAFT_282220 [Cutaneotrichosporon oleaginosum]TXT04605.1 hypothetical protein COLE_07424 [Cutaneotrichosporon oleaginosum]
MPSLLWKIQNVLTDLAHTPMLPPPPPPPTVELSPVFSTPSPSLRFPSSASYTIGSGSEASSFEIDAEAAPAVRDMVRCRSSVLTPDRCRDAGQAGRVGRSRLRLSMGISGWYNNRI